MKKGFKVALAILGVAVAILIIGRMGWYETHSVRYGSIAKVEDNKVLFEDSDGYAWYFYGDGYKVNDIVEATFWNATTKAIEDDEIETVKVLQR